MRSGEEAGGTARGATKGGGLSYAPVLAWMMCTAGASAQGIVTTVAGTDYIFPDDGKPALQGHLSTPYSVAFDRQGNLFFSDAGLNMVLKMDTTGVVSIVAGNGLQRFAGDGGPARAASLASPWGVALDAAGDLFIADSGNNLVRKVDTKGVITTVAGGGPAYPNDGNPATQAQLNQPTGLALDPSGNLLIGERSGQRVRKVNVAGIISTIAGTGANGFSGDGGPAVNASFANAQALAVAPDGTIFVADANNGRVRKIDLNGIITTIAGGGNDPNGTGGPATSIYMNRVSGLALDSQGNIYLTEDAGIRARRISPQGIVTNIAGTGVAGFSGDGGPAIQAKFNSMFGIALDAAGNVYITDRLNGRLRRVDATGTVNTVAGLGRYLGDAGPAVKAVLAGPDKSGTGDIAVDAQGNLYIADTANERIRKVTPDGQINTVAGTGFLGPGTDGVQATASNLQDPGGVAVDPQGNLLIGDKNNAELRKVAADGTISTLVSGPDASFVSHIAVDPSGNIYYSVFQGTCQCTVKKLSPSGALSTIVSSNAPAFSGDGGPAASASVGTVGGLAVDASGNLYLADTYANRVRRVNPQGIISTAAGTGRYGDSGDGGAALNATLSLFASGLAVDAAGNLYVSTAARVRQVGTDGIIRPWAGGSTFGFAGDGGPAISAAFAGPSSLALTPQGNLYVFDLGNRRVRLVQAAGGPSIVTSQNGLTFIASTGGGAPAPQTFTIVNGGQGTLSWGVSASTLSGGNWLAVSPASGTSPAGAAGPPVQVTVNASGLSAGDYYGQVQILGTGAPNSPQSATVVLSVRAPGSGTGSIVQPSGLLFTSTAPQSLTLSTLSTTPVSYSGTASFGGTAWFTLTGGTGTTVSGKPATVQVVPSTSGLAAGVYNGNVTFAFSDNSVRSVQLLLVLAAGGGARPNATGVRAAACAPSKLLPLFTSFGTGFNITTGWPSPVELRVVDDCGTALTRGTVTASFSNSDPALSLNSLGDGRWTGTWQAQSARSSVTVTASAASVDGMLNGSAQVSGGLSANANPPPVVAQGGVLNAASYQLQGALAPGSLVSIFGTLLAQGSASASALPLQNTLAGAMVTVAGRALPLLYASATQVNAQIPYDLPINATHQLIVQRGTAISVPQPVSVLSSQSGVFTRDLSGQGAAIVVRVAADGTQSVVSTSNPTTAYEALVIYCAGLGDVNPRLIAGQQAPFMPLSLTLDTATVTIGGVPAPVFFAGATPGFTGLYQVNAYVPTGVTSGDSVPLVITQAGRTSPPVTISVR
jgi:uncharacterized protein (TIGR03437 family)